jgi:hypothetical protein
MVFEFIRLATLKTFRSAALGRNLMSGLITGVFVLIIMLYVFAIAFALGPILSRAVGPENVVEFLNTLMLYFFLFELLYRYFFQKRPTFDIESYLHLPIKRATIIHFLLGRSLISPFSLVVILMFMPITFGTLSPDYGLSGALSWLFSLVLISISMHWFMLWYKQRMGSSPWATILILVPIIIIYSLAYFNIVVVGNYTLAFFDALLLSIVPLGFLILLCITLYYVAFSYYVKNAYLEENQKDDVFHVTNTFTGVFSRFGLSGEIADMELKLILRHKKSRSYLFISAGLLFYGLFFYPNDVYADMTFLYLFIGVFITGALILQYGQLFLSWNSANFDFFITKKQGIEALVKGKWLLFVLVSTAFYLLALPYVYFGWNILAFHTAGFLYNIGIGVHLIIYIALWEPKPMDLGKGAMFNYDGIGLAQFLMIIPYLVFPYLVFLPTSYFFNDYAGLFLLGLIGLCGLFFSDKLIGISVNKLQKDRYAVSSTFRREL